MRTLHVASLGVLLWACPAPGVAAEIAAAEAPVADVDSLLDCTGRRRSLHAFADYDAVVLAFLGVDCPVANLYVPRLKELEFQWREHNVQFLAVYPHAHESLDDVAAHACDRDIPFPVLKDLDQRLADALGVTRTPEVVVLDRNFRLRYRGRIDDQYAVNHRAQAATRSYLANAIQAVVGGSEVPLARTGADGCLLDRDRPRSVTRQVSYHRDVAAVLAQRCQGCHTAGQAAPFVLQDYGDAVRWSAMIKEVIRERRMPPWHADARHGQFRNDRRLTDDEIRLVCDWVDQGLAEGNPAEAPPPLVTSAPPEVVYDVELPANREFQVPADGVLPYEYFQLDEEQTRAIFAGDRWVQRAELAPAAPQVVHHIMAFSVPPGRLGPPGSLEDVQIVTIWAPGEPNFSFPPDTALRIAAGSRLVLQVHYTPNGQAAVDRPRVRLQFARQKPAWEVAMTTHENRGFRIAPGDPHSLCKFIYLVRDTQHTQLLGLMPHLHLRGKCFQFVAYYPDGRRETLMSVPRYDFNWQTLYWFREPKTLPVGTRIHAIAHWDNSRNNPANPDPAAEVHYGQQTADEMMVAGMMFLFPAQ